MGKRFAGLELLRFASAVVVVLWHYPHLFSPGVYDDELRSTHHLPLFDILGWFYRNGQGAVQVFWIISGFIFFWKYADALFDRSVSWQKFVILRFSRLYPLHVSTLFLVAGLQLFYRRTHGVDFVFENNDFPHFMMHLAFASNWFGVQPLSFNGPIWSVSAEIVAYAAFLVVALRVRNAGWMILLGVCIAIMLKFAPGGLFGSTLVSCVLYFFAGGAVFWTVKWAERLSHSVHLGVLIVLLLVGVVILPVPSFAGRIIGPATYVLIVFSGALSDLIIGHKILTRAAGLGNLTYSSYLLHFPIQIVLVLMSDAIGLARSAYESPIALGLYMSLVFLLSPFVFYQFERPAQAAIRNLAFRTRTPGGGLRAAKPS